MPLMMSWRFATGCSSSMLSGIFSEMVAICSCVPMIATGRFSVFDVAVGHANASRTIDTATVAISAARTLLVHAGLWRGSGALTCDTTHSFHKECLFLKSVGLLR